MSSWQWRGSKVAPGPCHQLLTPTACAVGIGEGHIHLQTFPDETQATATLGFLGEGGITGGK